MLSDQVPLNDPFGGWIHWNEVPELAVRMINWFFQPPQVAKFVCDGEPGLTNKGYNDKGWCVEYTPAEIKRAVVGYGRAEKHQVQQMVKLILGLTAPPSPHDAADALAVAVCHIHSQPPARVRQALATPPARARKAATSWRHYRP